jgi:hypothetical protein
MMMARSVKTRRFCRRDGRWARLLTGGVAGTLAVMTFVSGTASAQQRPSQPLAGATIECASKTMTFVDGYQVGDLHRVMLGNGNQVVLVDVVIHAARVVDDTGEVFRVVGGANSVAHVPVASGGEVTGHFNVNLTVVGDGGLLGRVWLRERLLPDGSDIVLSGGGCSF